MMKRAITILAAAISAVMFAAITADASPLVNGVPYIDASGDARTRDLVWVIDPQNIPKATEGMWPGAHAWYVVRGKVTVDHHVDLQGGVHLILEDGADITFKQGIGAVKGTGTLEIYSQSLGDNMGKLTAFGGTTYRAGIGGGKEQDSGAITINGGIVEATGGAWAAGIGGGSNADGSEIAINGGRVTAKGSGDAAGIGGGTGSLGIYATSSKGGNAKDIAICGGIVEATGGARAAGIGGGHRGRGTDIKITGGIVRALGGDDAPAIGSGYSKSAHDAGNEITIQGGTVYATSGYYCASAIGGRGQDSKIISGADGRAFISASVLSCDMSQFVSGVLFVAKDGTVHGSPTISASADMPSGGKLIVKSDQTLTIAKGSTLNATSGDIELDGGVLVNDGLISLPASYKDKILSKVLVIKGSGALEFAGDSAVYNNDGTIRSESGDGIRSGSSSGCSSGATVIFLLAIITLTRSFQRRIAREL